MIQGLAIPADLLVCIGFLLRAAARPDHTFSFWADFGIGATGLVFVLGGIVFPELRR